MTWTATPREDWPTHLEADQEPPSVALPPAESAALTARLVALQATADGHGP